MLAHTCHPSTQEKQEEQEFKVIFPYSELETSLIQRNKTGPGTAQWQSDCLVKALCMITPKQQINV